MTTIARHCFYSIQLRWFVMVFHLMPEEVPGRKSPRRSPIEQYQGCLPSTIVLCLPSDSTVACWNRAEKPNLARGVSKRSMRSNSFGAVLRRSNASVVRSRKLGIAHLSRCVILVGLASIGRNQCVCRRHDGPCRCRRSGEWRAIRIFLFRRRCGRKFGILANFCTAMSRVVTRHVSKNKTQRTVRRVVNSIALSLFAAVWTERKKNSTCHRFVCVTIRRMSQAERESVERNINGHPRYPMRNLRKTKNPRFLARARCTECLCVCQVKRTVTRKRTDLNA